MRNVHLVGSVPLRDRDEVFRTAAATLGPRLKRYSDGETGERCRWMPWQRPVFADNQQLEPSATQAFVPGQSYDQFRPKSGVTAADVRFGSLGYVENAQSSYPDFVRLRADGVIPASARFLVTIPTPTAQLFCFVAPDARPALEPVFFERVLQEVDRLAAAIPHADLALQWDTVHEILMMSGAKDKPYFLGRVALMERLIRLGDRVPSAVELGFHFCYGDSNHKHSLEPEDTRVMVEVANELSARITRPVQYFHMPVPRGRDDAAYYSPLKGLQLRPQTEIYLGLVHFSDGLDGARRRMTAASRFLSDYGVATECGFGRRKPDTVRPLLELHAEAAGLST
jgi:hypothetical protein